MRRRSSNQASKTDDSRNATGLGNSLRRHRKLEGAGHMQDLERPVVNASLTKRSRRALEQADALRRTYSAALVPARSQLLLNLQTNAASAPVPTDLSGRFTLRSR